MEPTSELLRELLRRARTIAVVGLSADPTRASFRVAAYLQRQGYRIIPVNPVLTEPVLGETPYARLSDVPVPIDIVDVFRRPDQVPPIADEAVAVRAGALWLQLGIRNDAAAAIARAAGLTVVMDRCLMVDHQALLGASPAV
ncbi:MAG: CoA-binding protein [Chloroflexi bacterium]|jgi:predicted CoA-binding protein|nr:CoA-binding protein [Chloroflexota bacterium]